MCPHGACSNALKNTPRRVISTNAGNSGKVNLRERGNREPRITLHENSFKGILVCVTELSMASGGSQSTALNAIAFLYGCLNRNRDEKLVIYVGTKTVPTLLSTSVTGPTNQIRLTDRNKPLPRIGRPWSPWPTWGRLRRGRIQRRAAASKWLLPDCVRYRHRLTTGRD